MREEQVINEHVEHTHYIRYDNGGAILEYDGKIYIDETPDILQN